MDNKAKLKIGGGVAALVLGGLLLPRAVFGGTIDLANVFLPDFLLTAGGTTPKQDAQSAALWVNSLAEFGGWFSNPDHSVDDIMAIWAVESNYNPRALNTNDGGQGNHAFGIGQVLASTAGDFGITQPEVMLDLRTGARVSMAYSMWTHEFLQSRLGRAPTKREWIGAYNAGVGNVLNGNLPELYITKWTLKRALV